MKKEDLSRWEIDFNPSAAGKDEYE